jgi:mono/diheme cytochrome c family protein
MRDTQVAVKAKVESGGRVGNILSTSAAALGIEFVLQVLAGWYLNRAYIPDPKLAHGTVENLLGATPHAQIAGFHYWGGAFFIAHSSLHLCLMLFTGWYRPPHHWRWVAAIAFFICALMFQITGNLLPFDQHGVQTAAIEGGIAASMPGGQQVAAIMMGGEPSLTANTLPTWYFAHRLLLPFALLLGAIGAVITHFKLRDTKTLWPVSAVLALVPLVIALTIQRPLGTAATEADFNRYNALVSWYTWPLHGSLEAFNRLNPSLGFIGTAVIPTLFVLFLLAAPMLSKRVANAGVQFIFVAFLAYFLGVGFAFGGAFAPLTGTRDPAGQVVSNPDKPANPIDAVLAARGKEVFNAESCAGCHGKDGLKATGGPKLDQVHKDHSDAEWYIEFIKNPKSKKPNSTMPGFPDMEEDKLKAMAEFLRQPR